MVAVAELTDEPRQVYRLKPLTEEEVLDRIERLQEHLRLPDEVWGCLVEILCPDTLEEPPLDPEPTSTLPGTEARLRVLERRMERGFSLFHPDDLTWDADITDRLAIAGCRLRNGVASRLGMPLVEQRHDGQHETEGVVREGFRLAGENVLVVGKVEPRRRRKREAVATGEQPQQMLLFTLN